MKNALITGVTGQDGAYLAELLLNDGYKVFGTVRNDMPEPMFRLETLGIADEVELVKIDYRKADDFYSVIKKIMPDEIYNFASQSSVFKSFENPALTFEINTTFVLNILEAVRLFSPKTKIFQASSSEIFGKPESLPVTENSLINPINFYGVSKTSAHMLADKYRELHNIFVCSGILFNHESILRDDHFIVKKIIKDAVAIKEGKKEKLYVGNTSVRRDFGYAPEYVRGMALSLRAEKADDYIFCSGKSISIDEIIAHVFKTLDLSLDKVEHSKELYRPVDIEDVYGSHEKALKILNWEYTKNFTDVLDEMIEHQLKNSGEKNSFYE